MENNPGFFNPLLSDFKVIPLASNHTNTSTCICCEVMIGGTINTRVEWKLKRLIWNHENGWLTVTTWVRCGPVIIVFVLSNRLFSDYLQYYSTIELYLWDVQNIAITTLWCSNSAWFEIEVYSIDWIPIWNLMGNGVSILARKRTQNAQINT